ncbi:MAG: hypothetical protein ACXAC7_10960, partial [Candidatus Hodarchaeales archaeon]
MSLPEYSLSTLKSNCSKLGTGFLPVTLDNWWFAVGKKDYWRQSDSNKLMISFTAIGGHVASKESFIEATTREV